MPLSNAEQPFTYRERLVIKIQSNERPGETSNPVKERGGQFCFKSNESGYEKSTVPSSRTPWVTARDLLMTSLALIFLEVVNFAWQMKQVGFYLDDWLMLNTLRFGPQNFFDALGNYFLNDPKVVIRPIQALHFGSLYFMSGLRPIGYHVSNCIFEVIAAIVAYLCLSRLTSNRLLSFMVAMGVLLYPVHDATHYWILCCSVPLSLALYFGSLWLSIEGALKNKFYYHWLSGVALLLSIYSYEVYLPLALVNVISVYLIHRRAESVQASARKAALAFVPLFAAGASLWIYQRFIVPNIALAYLHRVTLDPVRILYVTLQGALKTFAFDVAALSKEQIGYLLNAGISHWQAVMLVLAGLVSFFSVDKLAVEQKGLYARGAKELIIIGLATVLVSFSIFGLNTEYEPALLTIVNRINMGAAFGWFCVYAGLAGFLAGAFAKSGGARPRVRAAAFLMAATVALVNVAFTMTNWELAKPWVVSWKAQSNILYLMKSRAGKIPSDHSIILTDCPRYVMCSPVFDGIWDFQSMVRLALSDPKIKGGVVSERLRMAPGELQDVSMGYMCASYPFGNLSVLVPGDNKLVEAPTADAFIDIVEKKGADRLSSGTIEKWRRQAELVRGCENYLSR